MSESLEHVPSGPLEEGSDIKDTREKIDGKQQRSCWVCFASDEDDCTASWSRPCRCRGTTKWVHKVCLQRWINEKQKGNVTTKVSCPQCNTEYTIIFPPFGHIVYVLDVVDRVLYKVCPFIAAGVVVGSIYWTAVTYGAVTVMQVLGHKEGLGVMEQADPLFLLVGLPTIPIMLILARMVRWEDYLLKLWHRHSARIPGIKHLLNSIDNGLQDVQQRSSLSDPVSATRILCGALVMPTVAAICGKLIFGSVASSLQRTLLGGVAFVGIKGVVKIYLKHQQYSRQFKREIKDFDQTDSENRTDQASQTTSS